MIEFNKYLEIENDVLIFICILLSSILEKVNLAW